MWQGSPGSSPRRSVVRATISRPGASETNSSNEVPRSATSEMVPGSPPDPRSDTCSGRMLHRTGVLGARSPVGAAILKPSASIHPSESTTARWRLAMPNRRATSGDDGYVKTSRVGLACNVLAVGYHDYLVGQERSLLGVMGDQHGRQPGVVLQSP